MLRSLRQKTGDYAPKHPKIALFFTFLPVLHCFWQFFDLINGHRISFYLYQYPSIELIKSNYAILEKQSAPFFVIAPFLAVLYILASVYT